MENNPKVCMITATKDRHQHLERVVRFALNQTYQNWVHLIYNNSTTPQRLNENLSKDKFLLINKFLSTKTKKPYTTLGEIYNDILLYTPPDVDIICFWDDDDIYLPDHLEEGVKGMERCGLKAYKPKKSWFKQGKSVSLQENVLEPSIFVKAQHIRDLGFSEETTAQHLKWLNPLVNSKQICADPNGKPTYICDWSQELPTFKTSGDPHNPNNFNNYSRSSKDVGDGIITPCPKVLAEHYYKLR